LSSKGFNRADPHQWETHVFNESLTSIILWGNCGQQSWGTRKTF
jgi:hypothetical protein